MTSIHEIKRREITETPVLLFACVLPSGAVERWSTHRITVGSEAYQARVLAHDQFEIRAGSDDGIDAISKTSVLLANADGHFSQLNRAQGLKGARLTVSFLFFNVSEQQPASEPLVVFRGICNPPDEITETHIRLSFTSRMNMQRLMLPEVRVQRRCPWTFPTTSAQRAEAVSGGSEGPYSRLFRCGYSADHDGGAGNTGAGGAFASCDYTRAQCVERGMFDEDSQGRVTRRFGGIEYVPSTISVKSYGEKATQLSGAIENEAKYNDFVPVVYGTAWQRPPVVFARNDGNLTRLEVLLGMGEIDGVLKVIVNGNDLPEGNKATHATATGWYNVVSYGTRVGGFNLDFTDASGKPLGDPYGTMAVLSVVVPNRISDGSPLPKIDVLMRGMKLPVYDESGEWVENTYSNNPAWIILDVLRRSGWKLDELELASFARTAAYCAEPIETADLNGNSKTVPRFQCNMVLRRRRSASDVVRGVRNSAGLYMTYGLGGKLELHAESTLAIQQPVKPECSNSLETLGGGWPAYEFGDGTSGFSDIVRRQDGRPAFRVWSRSTAESPNRFSIEFQDEFNEYQQDSLSLVDMEDAAYGGHEINGSLTALGIPNFNQAARMIRLQLDKSLRANTYVDFETGVRALGIKPGDLITLTYAKEGFDRQPFRVVRVRPGTNYSSTAITAQIHEDQWYSGGGGALGVIGGGRQPAHETGLPRPLLGTVAGEDGTTDFGIAEEYKQKTDGSYEVTVKVEFATPTKPTETAPRMPLLHLAPEIESTGGSLDGAQDLYYAVSAVTEDGSESPLSFLVRAAIPAGTQTNQVRIKGLSFSPETTGFHVYRGQSPLQLMRIAENQGILETYTDLGAEAEIAAPPDQSYDHANFYWRLELLPEFDAEIYSTSTIGNPTLEMIENEYRGNLVRITKGRGRGQERLVSSNDATTLTVSPHWAVEPDSTSSFVVAEGSWTFGSLAQASPASFSIPNRQKAVIHLSGRAANVADRECAFELSPLTRHTIGGAAEDLDVAAAPVFGLTSSGQGRLEVTGVGFEDLVNTRSITAGTLTLHYWDEVSGAAPTELAVSVDVESTTLLLASAASCGPGALVQIAGEVMEVRTVHDGGVRLEVARGAYETTAVTHDAGAGMFVLQRKAFIVPFVRGFFGTPASGSYSHSMVLPCSRVVVAEFFVTNAKGNSQVSSACYSGTVDGGIRTLSGGQFVLQVDGPLAIQSNAVPPVSVDADRSVRDIFATMAEAPTGGSLLVRLMQDAEFYCDLVVEAGATRSESVDGRDLPPLRANKRLGLEVVEVGSTMPGSGLTVTIRV